MIRLARPRRRHWRRDLRERLSRLLVRLRSADRPRVTHRLVVFALEPGRASRGARLIRVGPPAVALDTLVNRRARTLRGRVLAPGVAAYEIDPRDLVHWENHLVVPAGPAVYRVLARGPAHEAAPSLALSGGGAPVGRPEVDAALAFLDRARNRSPGSDHVGLPYGCYDLDDRTWRLSSWVWPAAVVARAWLAVAERFDAPAWREAAVDLSRRLLARQVRGGEHHGAFVVRIDVEPGSPTGCVEWMAPNDAAFLGAYGIAPLCRPGGEPDALAALLRLGEWVAGPGMAADGRLRVGYAAERGRWDESWLYVDSGFTTLLFRELWLLTGETRWREACRRFADWYLAAFDHPSGALRASWHRDRRGSARRFFSRGLGWGLEGLLGAFECTGDARYLDRAARLGDFCLRAQAPSGAWHYETGDPAGGECNKATPVLAWTLARLAALRGEARYADAARRALAWCDAHRHGAPGARRNDWRAPADPQAAGGIVSWTWEGCITRPRNRSTAVPYASAYALLALLSLEGRSPAGG